MSLPLMSDGLRIQARLERPGFALDVDTAIPLEGVTALFGRSGCGKTTLLRIIAGLEHPPGAELHFGNTVWQSGKTFVPLHRRRVGLVFQESTLLPHLSVRGNLLYGYKRTPEPLRRLHLDEVADLLGIDELLERRAEALSGGQRQRVALGRALLTSPDLLLLDEPLNALDTQTKREIMPFLARLSEETGIPTLLVTHAPDEVERLAHRVAFMHQGRLERLEPLREALARADSPLFRDEGAVSVLQGELGPPDEHGLHPFGPPEARYRVPTTPGATNGAGNQARLRIDARDVSLALTAPEDVSILNILPVTIESRDEAPGHHGPARVLVTCRQDDGQTLMAELTRLSTERLRLKPGTRAHALVKSVAFLD
ncbi:molybdenum ABC transporter ATP-binding protein [Thioalkalivibrio halophilus]|uniref:Molybdenum ABC transporter ATP-binding protein n=2 Tax=Thioalkalivibrio halophilus TaxID=252474 RepID=A0A1V2ZZ38_9GAMM|nr:molybdenum ABC transporter ATP-binding protein [Thioalkalivibrio halophilus]OOC10341.1 molybdenum ABC transporter ATP-binding protein [Thioalkalivibrio halophilus]